MTLNIELFPCAGGMSEGFRRAGIDFDLAFDFDLDACNSYERNLGHRPIQIDVRDLLRMAMTACWFGEVDLVVADPPCKPWSRAGKRRGTEDPRDMIKTTVDFIIRTRPATYLIGNVPGLDDSTNWPTLQALLAPLRIAGYCIADHTALNAANYGVPQMRIRPFWFGHLRGPCIRWPTPTHADPKKLATATLPGVELLLPWLTCRDVLAHLPPELLGKSIRLRARGTNGDGMAVDRVHYPEPDRPAKTISARHNRPDGLMWPWDRPATTVCADERIPPPGHHGNNSYMSNGVKLSERARAILQGFPEGWVFCGKTKTSRSSQIGMAMPPPLAHAVANSIREQIERTD